MRRMRPHSPLRKFLVLAVLSLWSLVACSHQEVPPPVTNSHVAALEQLSVSHLVYPGSVLLKQGALPPSQGIDGNSGASARKMYGIAAPLPAGVTGQAVLNWYHQQLQTQGWTSTPSPTLSGYTLEEYWTNGSYYADLGIWDNSFVPSYQPGVDITKYPLLFDVSVGERGYQGM